MKILSCYITGFGRFVNQAFDFTSNVNVVKADNGFGKTTLAAFIEAMFYGLEASRNRGVEENFRVKYAPWSGAAFGGSLVFLYKNHRYTIERTFGRTPSADECRLYDENRSLCKISGGNGESLGEKLFGVDKESFEKTAFITQKDSSLSEGVPESLLARLSAIFSSESEQGDMRAMARLDEAERKLRAKRKPAKGKLDEIDEQLQTLTIQQSEAQKASEEAQRLQEELGQMQGAGLRSTQKNEKKSSRKITRYAMLAGLILAVVGVAIVAFSLVIGIVSILLGLAILWVTIMPKNKQVQTKKIQEDAEKRGRILAQLEVLEGQAAQLVDLRAQEDELLKEKARLEKRLLAIIKAKEILSQAKTGAALRYLDSVEKTCKKYADFLGLNWETFALNATAQASLQENGRVREMGYYSLGMQALYALCVRLALAEAVFQEEVPPLILDDPLVYLDDEKTEKAKRLILEFSKKYQIVYFTCKAERRL